MSVLRGVCVLVMCVILVVKSNTSGDKRFVRDINLNGHICKEEHIVFQANLSGMSCAVKCLDYPSCSGIFCDSDSKQCVGCDSTNGVVGVANQQYKFYKRERKSHYIGCYSDFPRIFGEYNVISDSMTTEFCISHCLFRANIYAMTEFESECFCGNKSTFMYMDIQVPDTDCNYTCSGDSSQICGGFFTGSVYYTVL